MGIESLPWDHALYLLIAGSWDEQSVSAVLDPDETENDQEEPAAARERGLRYALDIATVRDVVLNIQEQHPTVDLALLLRALIHYYEHDAFLNL
jgi:hypothetical protein